MARRFIDVSALDTLRRNADWNAVCAALGIKPDPKRSKPEDWWARSPFSEDATPSFHIKPNDGVWYCFSTRQGGGVIELVQRIYELNCFEAGEWLIDHGCAPEPVDVSIEEKKKPAPAPMRSQTSAVRAACGARADGASINPPIRQSLLPALSEHGTHPEFVRRGISEKTCHYLGCGYLASGRSKLKERVVFQVRGVQETAAGLEPAILTHIGRATTEEQIETQGKWLNYGGFRKNAALYNIDKLLFDPFALDQVRRTGQVLVVEGPFDVAKLVEAGVTNVVATMGAYLDEAALPLIDRIRSHANEPEFLIWYDRDTAGRKGHEQAIALLDGRDCAAATFDWEARFGAEKIAIPESITDPCAMNVTQLRWLRAKGLI